MIPLKRSDFVLKRGEGDSNPRGKTHRISNPTQWPGYAIAASIRPTLLFEIKQTVNRIQLKKSWNSSSKFAGLFAARFATTRFMRFLFFKISGTKGLLEDRVFGFSADFRP